MSARNKILATVAGFTLLGGICVLGAAEAQASTPGCAFGNGCATEHGTNALGEAAAMDTKYKNKTEIVIGYPDNANDGATSYDGDLHHTRATSTTTWDDTEVLPAWPAVDTTRTGPSTTLGIYAPSIHLDVPTGVWSFQVDGGSGPYTATVSGLSDSNSSATVTPAITVVAGSPSTTPNADLAVNGATLAPGLYDNVTLTITDSGTPTPSTVSYTLIVRVFAHQVTIPGGDKPYYTYVYAPNGTWTNQCVTDINGSGALRMYPCTAGHDPGQDFTTDGAGGLLSATPAHVSNLLAASVGANSCLTDPSVSNPATPQSDAADQTPTGGRQLYVNGSCAASTDLWSWGT